MTHEDRGPSRQRQPRQGRLFAPLGMHKGDPAKLQPENWAQGSIPNQTIAYHGTEQSNLPARDRPHESPNLKVSLADDPDWADSEDHEDSEGRPMAEYGSAVGMHYGTVKAALSRGQPGSVGTSWIHPVSLPTSEMTPPPRNQLGAAHGDLFSSSEGGMLRTKEGTWRDYAANYDERATDLVEQGKVIPYTNELEDPGNVSYRALPETAKTWGETVLEAHEQHNPFADRWGRSSNSDWGNAKQGLPRPTTGQVAAAKAGYNPTIPVKENDRELRLRPHQESLFGSETYDYENEKYIGHHASESGAYRQVQRMQGEALSAGALPPRVHAETPRPWYMKDAEEQHAALSKVQFMKTGHRE